MTELVQITVDERAGFACARVLKRDNHYKRYDARKCDYRATQSHIKRRPRFVQAATSGRHASAGLCRLLSIRQAHFETLNAQG